MYSVPFPGPMLFFVVTEHHAIPHIISMDEKTCKLMQICLLNNPIVNYVCSLSQERPSSRL